MTELVGYLDRWSARPGDTVAVFLSSERTSRVSIDLLRLGSGDQRAEPDGIAYAPVESMPPIDVEVGPQPTDAGSYAEITGLARLDLEQATLGVLLQPWTVGGDEQTVLALESPSASLAVVLDASGAIGLRIDGQHVASSWRPAPRRWSLLRLGWDRAKLSLTVMTTEGRCIARVDAGLGKPLRGFERLRLAGRAGPDGTVGAHFDGRIERPILWPAEVDDAALRSALLVDVAAPVNACACWDFALAMDGSCIVDTGPHGLHGTLHQGPKRAVRGARWRGVQFDWRQVPADYAAIHFHRDDLLDAGWAAVASLRLPEAIGSGAYAVRARCMDESPGTSFTGGLARLPLFVRARRGTETGADVAVVFPTFTYLAYANDRCALMGNNPEVLAACAVSLEPSEVLLSHHPEWGLSLYDTHHDGSGVALTSRHRPLPTFHPDQRAWQTGEGSGRWNYPADLILVEWLEREGIAWHALSDEDLQGEGATALAPYRVVLTGNHPEYATPQLIGAYREHLGQGGRLMVLGGNGFYWKIASHPAQPGVIELRRAEDGNRSWAEEPGEYYHAFDGEYGGLWRRNGLAPQSWLGVGYCGQGFRRSVGYSRTADSFKPEVAFVFEDVDGSHFGRQGIIGGGCAGIEVDRADVLLGTDPDGYLLATSEPFDATYLVANEELLVSRPTITADLSTTVRADMHLQRSPGGGVVFATGSIAWIGGLATHGGDLSVQRITKNVLQRFLDPKPLLCKKGDHDES